MATVGDETFCRAAILGDETRRDVDAFEMREAEALEGVEAVAAAAEELNNLCAARPLLRTEAVEASDELLNFLLRRFEAKVGGFPGVGYGDGGGASAGICGSVFHWRLAEIRAGRNFAQEVSHRLKNFSRLSAA